MITIIICGQLGYSFIVGPVLIFCQFADFRFEITQHLFLRYATDGCILWLKTDVAQVVEYREERNLRKLGNAGDEDELLIFVVSFQYGKHLSIDAGTCFVLRCLPGMLQRRVVFIDKDGNLLPCLLICSHDYRIEAVGKTICRGRNQ